MRLILAATAAMFALMFNVRADSLPPIKTVFVIVLENQRWDNIVGNPSAPFINGGLLPRASYCNAYYNSYLLPHPSEPNYIWLEAGTNYEIVDNTTPFQHHLNTTNHLVTLLRNASISWRTYQEDICGCNVPLTNTNGYVTKHNPFVFFDDITGTNNLANAYGIAHIRPYSEFAQDLAQNTMARYNFITPNLCHDMHDTCPPRFDPVRQGDDWLATEIPRIMASQAYKNGGAIFITWDEPGITGYAPIGMIVLSPFAKGGGFASNVTHSHSSTLRTVEEIFGVTPLLAEAATAVDLGELFSAPLPTNQPGCSLSFAQLPDGTFNLSVRGAQPGRSHLIQSSTDLVTWTDLSTNVPNTDSFNYLDTSPGTDQQFYRVIRLP